MARAKRTVAGKSAAERLELLERAVERLREEAEYGTVVVEGSRDLSALEWLGIGGHHVALHQGRALQDVVDDLASSPPPVVVLVDWDRTGGRIVARIEEILRGRIRVDLESRRRLALAAHSKCLEDLPGELGSLRAAFRER